MYLPSSENEFLASVLASMKKRQKAIKYKTTAMTCDKVIETHDSVRKEKLETSFRWMKRDLRAFVWEDRWVWVDFRSASKRGWLWEWTFEGRLLPRHDGRVLVDALEKTLDAAPSDDAGDVSVFGAIWRTLLAQGPKPVG